MTSARRHINSTGRKRIPHAAVDFRMLETSPGESLRATASLNFTGFEFPSSASVAIEAYHKSSGMRFDCGTIGDLRIPPVLTLDQVDRGAGVVFRVKVIDNESHPGCLLGAAERIRPKGDDRTNGRRSLFPLAKRDLGPLIWKVEVDDDTPPMLIINSAIPGFEYRILESPFFRGLLLPAALRIVLECLVRDTGADEDDEGDWKSEWLRFCREELGVADDPSELTDVDARDAWVENAVRSFCESGDFVGAIRKQIEGEH